MTTTTAITASPAKLKNGSWGARVRGDVTEGDTITITTRGGKSWDARVTKVVWSGEGVAVCATESLDRAPARTSRSRYGRYERSGACGYPCPVSGRRCTSSDPCHDCQ
jgi:hypothetical protein